MGHVPHVLVSEPWVGSRLALAPEVVRHLSRVLRLAVGDPVSYTDGRGLLGTGSWSADAIERGEEARQARPVAHLTVACAVPKARERQRFIVEKLAELGVARLQWLRCSFSEGRPPSRSKQRMWAQAALEQSRGAFLMESSGPVDWTDLEPPVVLADPSGSEVEHTPKTTATLVIGPEGGWAPDELERTELRLRLGPTVLRTETAAVVGAATMLRHLDDHP